MTDMEEIYSTDNAGQLRTKLNANFGSGSGIQEVESTDYASQLVSKVNDNFELIEDSGLSQKFRFLHISDLHGEADALEECADMMDGDDRYKFLLITGDLSQYGTNIITADITNVIADVTDGRLLMCAGNHDVWDLKSGNQAQVTAWLKGYMGNNVNWGDSNNVGGYWYKDFQVGENTLRIISLDQYETSLHNNKNFVTYTQKQIDWFIDRLEELTANDYLIILCHHPLVQNQPVEDNNTPQADITDAYAQAIATIGGDSGKLFVSNGLYGWTNPPGVQGLNLIPRIMRAYMHGEDLQNFTYNNKGGDPLDPDITINEDFSLLTPCTFLFYAGGHLHGDVCYYMPDETGATDGGDWSDQLMLHITAASRSVNYAYMDDLGGTDTTGHRLTPTPANPSVETYRINEVVLDFEDKTIRVIRHGDKNTSDGRTRTAITFPFKKQ